MRNACLVLSVLILSVAPCEAEGGLAEQMLAAHNAERATLDLAPLTWSQALATNAAIWADVLALTGRFEHSRNEERPGEGENLWRGTANAYSPGEMVHGWSEEKAYFRDGLFPQVQDTPQDSHVVGHYTQMIWKSTTAVGCALAVGGGWDVLVCRYSPAGNIIGEAPY